MQQDQDILGFETGSLRQIKTLLKDSPNIAFQQNFVKATKSKNISKKVKNYFDVLFSAPHAVPFSEPYVCYIFLNYSPILTNIFTNS